MKFTKIIILSVLIVSLSSFSNSNILGKPVKIEVQTNYKTVEDALLASEEILLEESFITENRSDRTLMAKRGGIDNGFYSASVAGTKNDNGVLIKITFIKKGAGFYSIKKLSKKVKVKLETIKKDG